MQVLSPLEEFLGNAKIKGEKGVRGRPEGYAGSACLGRKTVEEATQKRAGGQMAYPSKKGIDKKGSSTTIKSEVPDALSVVHDPWRGESVKSSRSSKEEKYIRGTNLSNPGDSEGTDSAI